MKRLILIAAALLAPLAISAPANAQAAARNYDCSKAGNANKTVCKNAAAAAKPAPVPASTRNYDCTKAGNANKSACKGAVAASVPAPSTPKPRNYDCAKAGNFNKTACRGANTAAPAPAPRNYPAPSSRPAQTAPATYAPAPRAPAAGQNTNPAGPNGATAKCRDGSVSYSAHRSGTCSRHGGVAQWF
ncbi:DUF3761 domain-containing protein [Sphingomonas antarctica]|uniref:DUF3761 domain-containing protein n=1 Tax=Sphingomonas antarctica TaxID=2040274 RepID=UPI0039ED3959